MKISSILPPPQSLFDEGEVEQQLAWHQSRLQSRIEAHQRWIVADLARFHRSNIYQLSVVRVLGSHHTRPEFLSKLFGPLLVNGQEQMLPEIFRRLDELQDKLAKLGIFSHLQVSLAATKDNPRGSRRLSILSNAAASPAPKTSLVEPKSLRPALACGQVRAEVPLLAARARAELAVNACKHDLSKFVSCNKTVKGVAAKLKTETGYGAHELSYDLTTRTIGSLLPGASDSIQQAAAASPNLKSAVTLSWFRDTRDHAKRPQFSGYSLNSQTPKYCQGINKSVCKKTALGGKRKPIKHK
ncbi:hypothetical protein PtA15_5A725 [Puccinia triticina]|uniref:Uncharacterized protein n=1 Tax=Puccinia triticina TaxID=208348 RepID=A0ABY7CM05_9BASI|nr:uncharacterized protein PtA15_5A725 [Puccinia triticina]WAQ85151.1 hypothetical protein PtA15_5A725 [Puccinia triticina]